MAQAGISPSQFPAISQGGAMAQTNLAQLKQQVLHQNEEYSKIQQQH